MTGWRTPRVDDAVLASAPNLRWILQVAGSVMHQLSPAIWERGIRVASAVDANAAPVTELTLAAILMANKRVADLARAYRERRAYIEQAELGVIGNYRRRIGIVGASRIGRRVADLLRPFDLEVVLLNRFSRTRRWESWGAVPLPLEDLCRTSDVVSLHAPVAPPQTGQARM